MSTTEPKLLKNKMSKQDLWKAIGIGTVYPLLHLVFEGIPRAFGLSWIPGWPKAIMYLLVIVAYTLAFGCLWGNRPKPTPELTKKQKRTRNIMLPVLLLIVVAMAVGRGFYGYPKISDYLHSPNHKHTAVVLEEPNKLYEIMKEYMPWESKTNKTVYPVRAWVFYEEKQRAGLITESETSKQSYSWLDDNTLEFVFTFTAFDEVVTFTEQITW
ncbi:MAG: hypothetical protein FWE98_08155 [Oscillospiraceae bacterium]|nr:hypothetical protein [Oscillospiraceae bacterium]